MISSEIFGEFYNIKFSDVFPDENVWLDLMKNGPIKVKMDDSSFLTLYYLLCSRYMNSTIKSDDVEQFKLKVLTDVYSYGPTWERRVQIQEVLRGLKEDEIRKGGKVVMNHALNPSKRPTTGSLEELDHIDEQNTNNSIKSKLDGYNALASLLDADLGVYIINRFEHLFINILMPQQTVMFKGE